MSEAETQPYDSPSNVDEWELPGSSEQHGAAPANTIEALMGLGVDEHYGDYKSDEYAGDDSRGVTHSQLNWGYWLALPWPESPESEPEPDDEPVQEGPIRLRGGGPTVQRYAGPAVRDPMLGSRLGKAVLGHRAISELPRRSESAQPEGEKAHRYLTTSYHSPARQQSPTTRVVEPQTLSRGGQRHVDHLLAFNAASTSRWRIQPRDPKVLRAVLETAARLAEYSAPRNTLNQEESAFRLYWQPYCRYLGISAERPDISQITWEEQQIEMSIWGGAISYIAAALAILVDA